MTRSRPLFGALMLTLGLFLFACMDATTKHLAQTYNVPLIVAVRYAVNLALMLVLLGPRQGSKLVRTQRTGLVLARACCLAAASLLVGLALQRMPVAETTTIGFLGPIIVVLVAGRMLGERVGISGWVAALLGFTGVLLIVRPGSGLETVGVLCALAAVGANTAYQLLSRTLVATERTIAMLFYTALTGSIIFGLMLPWSATGDPPDLVQTLMFLSLGLYGGVGHFLFTAAYRHAPATLLAPMTYLQLVWAALLGFAVFGHVPDALSLTGMVVVIISGVIVGLRHHRIAANESQRQAALADED
jgi:drug/metabolite transporter (DMT)-like permease